MSGPSEWVQVTPIMWRRDCGRFRLYARDDGRWEVCAIGEQFDLDIAPDHATAKRAAEDALRRLLVDALEALGPEL